MTEDRARLWNALQKHQRLTSDVRPRLKQRREDEGPDHQSKTTFFPWLSTMPTFSRLAIASAAPGACRPLCSHLASFAGRPARRSPPSLGADRLRSPGAPPEEACSAAAATAFSCEATSSAVAVPAATAAASFAAARSAFIGRILRVVRGVGPGLAEGSSAPGAEGSKEEEAMGALNEWEPVPERAAAEGEAYCDERERRESEKERSALRASVRPGQTEGDAPPS